MYDLTGFQRDLLYVIAGLEEPHGLAIKGETKRGRREIQARRDWEEGFLEAQ